MSIFSKVIGKVFGNKADKDLKVLLPYVEQINTEYEPLSALSDENLKNKFSKIKSDFLELIKNNKSEFYEQKLNNEDIDNKLYELEKQFLDNRMVEVFAIVKDACRRLCKEKLTSYKFSSSCK